MTLRGTLLLFCLAITVAGLLFFLHPNQDRPSNAPLFHRDPAQITRITITDGSESRSLTRHGENWEIDTIPHDQADTSEAMNLVSAALELKPLDILTPEDFKTRLSLAVTGLQDPKRSLLLHQENAPDQILYFGNEAVGEKRLFARFGDQKEVIIIPSTLADLALRPNDEFRNHHLTSLALENLQKIKLSQGLGELCLQVDKHQWKMTEPTSALISSNALSSWITPLLEAPILERLGSDQENLASYGLEEPRSAITFFRENSLTPITLSLGKVVDETKSSADATPAVYIRSSERHAIFKVPATLEKIFMISPDMLREHQLCNINLDTVDRIEITKPDLSIVLRRQPETPENWMTDGKDPSIIPAAEVEKMVSALNKITVSSFEIATPANLKSAGLEPASKETITLRFIAHLSENTPDNEAGDFLIKEIHFGRSSGTITFARVDHDPEVVEIPESTLSGLFDFKK